MVTRRRLGLLAAAPILANLGPKDAFAQESFQGFLAGVRAQARQAGISDATLSSAFAGITAPDPSVLEKDRHQPEFTMTWAQYRTRVVTPAKISGAQAAYRQNAPLLAAIDRRYPVTSSILVGIWGLESSYGATTGSTNEVLALATLAYDGRRAAYFRGQLLDALRILDHGDVSPGRMLGSWAGAMGQPQFMPDSYLRYAVDFDGDGRRDIWGSRADVLASIANYLARSGWRPGEPWGQSIRLPPGFDAAIAGRDQKRTLADWMRLGVRRDDGRPFGRGDILGAVVIPDGPGGEAYMVYPNFAAIRRYNPSDFYALAVGLIGDGAVV